MRVLALGVAALLPVAAQAQVGPDIERAIIQGNQIDQALQQGPAREAVRDGDGQAIDGEAGIYVLKVNEIFFIGGSAGLGYSSNPVRTADRLGDSFSFQAAATAGMRTKLGGRVDLGVNATVSGVEFFEGFAPSARNASSSVSLGTAIKGTPLYVSIAGFGGFNFDKSFGNGVAFYGGSATLSSGFGIGKRTVVQPSLGLTRQWSGISENNSTSLGAGLNIVHALSERVSVQGDVRVSRVWFDNFYEDVTLTRRRDWSYGVGLTTNYRLSPVANISLGAAYDKRDSSFFLSVYDNFDAALVLSGSIRF